MADKTFDLGDYVQVNQRIAILYELYPQARLVTDKVKVLTAPDGKQRVMVKALAYRTPDDAHPAVGYSWMELPGTSTFTKGSELENTETSAWGRAIAALGILIDRSIASDQEVKSKTQDPAPAKPPAIETVEGGLIGVASIGTSAPVDANLRQDETEGSNVGFVIGEGKAKVQVVAYGMLAEAVLPLIPGLVGQRVQVYGPVTQETMRVGNFDKHFQRVHLERIVTPDWVLPRPEAVSDALFDMDLVDAQTAGAR